MKLVLLNHLIVKYVNTVARCSRSLRRVLLSYKTSLSSSHRRILFRLNDHADVLLIFYLLRPSVLVRSINSRMIYSTQDCLSGAYRMRE